ncbi:hypothetical protein Bbelb_340560 [Branchiostoma belcheri]|nr:hypothetical protein Bbelb_340560 [Branchiostoma belcheri]
MWWTLGLWPNKNTTTTAQPRGADIHLPSLYQASGGIILVEAITHPSIHPLGQFVNSSGSFLPACGDQCGTWFSLPGLVYLRASQQRQETGGADKNPLVSGRGSNPRPNPGTSPQADTLTARPKRSGPIGRALCKLISEDLTLFDLHNYSEATARPSGLVEAMEEGAGWRLVGGLQRCLLGRQGQQQGLKAGLNLGQLSSPSRGYFARIGVYRPSFGGRPNSPRARLPRSSNLDRRAKGSCRPKNEFGTQGRLT